MSTPLEIATALSASSYEYLAISTQFYMNMILYIKLYGRNPSAYTSEQQSVVFGAYTDIEYYLGLATTALNDANNQLDISGNDSAVQSRVDEIQGNKTQINALSILSGLYVSGSSITSRTLPTVYAMNSYALQVNSYATVLSGGLYDPLPTSILMKAYEAATRADSIAAQYAASYAADFAAAAVAAIAANDSTAAAQAASDAQFAATKASERYTSASLNVTNATDYGSSGTFTYVSNGVYHTVSLSSLVSVTQTASTAAAASNTTAQNAIAPSPAPEPAPAPAPEPAPAPAPSPSPASADAHSHIEVNFNIEIGAESNISVLGESAPRVSNVVTATYKMPVNALYDSNNHIGLIEMWEPSDAPGDIRVAFAGNFSNGLNTTVDGAYAISLRRLCIGFQKILVNKLDCSQAVPYNDAKYSGITEYTLQRDFGRLALGTLAHYMFGHVDATVAITNDRTFVKDMLSIDDGETDETTNGPSVRYNAWRFKDDIHAELINNWYFPPPSETEANLAMRLTQSIYQKGIGGVESNVSNATTDSLAYIVKQVIGQDAQRTKMVDGSERTLNYHQLLRFYEGDIIYVNIKLKAPTPILVGNGQSSAVSAETLGNAYNTNNEQNYTIKIELGPAEDFGAGF